MAGMVVGVEVAGMGVVAAGMGVVAVGLLGFTVGAGEVVVGTVEVVDTAGAVAFMDLLSMVAGHTLVMGGAVIH